MRILIIEDEHKIANSLKKGLEQELFTVDVAYDGENGFDLASTEEYDIIVLDRLLPKVEGIEICKKLREQNIHSPILMLTAKGQIQDRVDGLNSGADDYLVKPFAFEELLARIKALIRRPKKITSSTLVVDNLSLNTETFEVKRETKSILLTHKEFSLLAYCMKHANTILSKDHIISHVWNYDADILPNTVEVYIGYLRNKIDKNFPEYKPLIHTVRGFGYKIGLKE
jgi:DNA-binding response OmpR family regulator